MEKKEDLTWVDSSGYPRELISIIKGCLDPNSENRLSAKEALDMLAHIKETIT